MEKTLIELDLPEAAETAKSTYTVRSKVRSHRKDKGESK